MIVAAYKQRNPPVNEAHLNAIFKNRDCYEVTHGNKTLIDHQCVTPSHILSLISTVFGWA